MLGVCFGGTLCPGKAPRPQRPRSLSGHRAWCRGSSPYCSGQCSQMFPTAPIALGRLGPPLCRAPALAVSQVGMPCASCSPPTDLHLGQSHLASSFCSAPPVAKQPVYSEQRHLWVCLTTTTKGPRPAACCWIGWHIQFATEALHSLWTEAPSVRPPCSLLRVSLNAQELRGCWPG